MRHQIAIGALFMFGIAALFFIFKLAPPADAFLASVSSCSAEATPRAKTDCVRHAVQNALATMPSKTVLELISTTDDKILYGECHFIGHIIGQETYKVASSIEEALDACSRECTSSCVHGVVAQAVITDIGGKEDMVEIAHTKNRTELVRITKKYCTNSAQCHGVGHALFIAYGALEEPLSICDETTRNTVEEHCFRGVFMESAGSLSSHSMREGENSSIFISYDDYGYPCNTVSEKFHHACLRYLPLIQSFVFKKKGIASAGEQLAVQIEECKKFSPASSRAACFEGLGFTRWKLAITEQERAVAFCNAMPALPDMKACMLGMAYFLAAREHDERSPDLCSHQTEQSTKRLCYEIIFQTLENKTGKQAANICEKAKNRKECSEEYILYDAKHADIKSFSLGILEEELAQ